MHYIIQEVWDSIGWLIVLFIFILGFYFIIWIYANLLSPWSSPKKKQETSIAEQQADAVLTILWLNENYSKIFETKEDKK